MLNNDCCEQNLGLMGQLTAQASGYTEFEVLNYKDALEQADVVTFLVAHKEFKGLDIMTNLDFCGVLN